MSADSNIFSSRYLDSLESYHYENKGILPWMVEFQGRVDPIAMQRAIRILTIRHPVLRALIHVDKQGYRLEVPHNNYPHLLSLRGGRDTCIRKIEEVKHFLHPALSCFLLVQEGSYGYFVSCLSHAVADAHASFAYLSELWSIYTKITAGYDIHSVHKGMLPRSTADILSERQTRRQPPPLVKNHSNQTKAREERARPRQVRPELVRLSSTESTSFIQYARNSGVTVGALIVGIMALVIRNNISAPEESPINIYAGVDHRTKFDPPIGLTECTGGFVFPRKVTVSISENADPIEISKEFKIRLENEIERRKSVIHGNSFVLDHKIEHEHLSLALNNWGQVPSFTRPSDVDFTDFSLVGLVSDEQASKLADVPQVCSLTTYTFNDIIHIAWHVPDEPDGSLLKEFLARCRNVNGS